MKLSQDSSERYSTKINDLIGGPYTFEGLESLVYLKKITPNTLLSREGVEGFQPIKEHPIGSRLFPNLTAPSSPQHWAPPGKHANSANPHRKHYRFSEAKFEKLNSDQDKNSKIVITDILDDIRQKEIESGRDIPPSFRFRLSKRTRDFWVMLIVGNALFLGSGVLMKNSYSMVFAIGGCGLFTFGLLWSMYGVMDRY